MHEYFAELEHQVDELAELLKTISLARQRTRNRGETPTSMVFGPRGTVTSITLPGDRTYGCEYDAEGNNTVH